MGARREVTNNTNLIVRNKQGSHDYFERFFADKTVDERFPICRLTGEYAFTIGTRVMGGDPRGGE